MIDFQVLINIRIIRNDSNSDTRFRWIDFELFWKYEEIRWIYDKNLNIQNQIDFDIVDIIYICIYIFRQNEE